MTISVLFERGFEERIFQMHTGPQTETLVVFSYPQDSRYIALGRLGSSVSCQYEYILGEFMNMWKGWITTTP